MAQSLYYPTKERFPGSQTMSQRAFKMSKTWDKSALLAVVCPIQTAISGLTWGYYAHLYNDCFECLSPHEIAA